MTMSQIKEVKVTVVGAVKKQELDMLHVAEIKHPGVIKYQ